MKLMLFDVKLFHALKHMWNHYLKNKDYIDTMNLNIEDFNVNIKEYMTASHVGKFNSSHLNRMSSLFHQHLFSFDDEVLKNAFCMLSVYTIAGEVTAGKFVANLIMVTLNFLKTSVYKFSVPYEHLIIEGEIINIKCVRSAREKCDSTWICDAKGCIVEKFLLESASILPNKSTYIEDLDLLGR